MSFKIYYFDIVESITAVSDSFSNREKRNVKTLAGYDFDHFCVILNKTSQ